MSSFEAEWTQIKKEVAAADVTKLASVKDHDSGGSSGDVRSSASEWRAAATGVGDLVAKVQAAVKGIAGEADFPASKEDEDYVRTVVSASVATGTWTEYLSRVQQRCKALSEQMVMAGDVHAHNDKQTGSAFSERHQQDEQRLADGINGLDDHPGYGDTAYTGGSIAQQQWEG